MSPFWKKKPNYHKIATKYAREQEKLGYPDVRMTPEEIADLHKQREREREACKPYRAKLVATGMITQDQIDELEELQYKYRSNNVTMEELHRFGELMSRLKTATEEAGEAWE